LQTAIGRGVKIKIIVDQSFDQTLIQGVEELGVEVRLVDTVKIVSYGMLIDDGLRLIIGNHRRGQCYVEIIKPILLQDNFRKQFNDLWVSV